MSIMDIGMKSHLRKFEIFTFSAMALGAIDTIWRVFTSASEFTISTVSFQILMLFILLTLVLLISRKDSQIAKVIYTIGFTGILLLTFLSFQDIYQVLTSGQMFNDEIRPVVVLIQVTLLSTGIYFLHFSDETVDKLPK
jgi:succinate-acetate transporter protein